MCENKIACNRRFDNRRLRYRHNFRKAKRCQFNAVSNNGNRGSSFFVIILYIFYLVCLFCQEGEKRQFLNETCRIIIIRRFTAPVERGAFSVRKPVWAVLPKSVPNASCRRRVCWTLPPGWRTRQSPGSRLV